MNNKNIYFPLLTKSDYQFHPLNIEINPLKLTFNRYSFEAIFQNTYYEWLCRRIRFGSLIIICMVLLNGIIHLNFSDLSQRIELWVIRLGVCSTIIFIFCTTYTTYFKSHHQSILLLLHLVCTAGICLVFVSQMANPTVVTFNTIILLFFLQCVFGVRFIFSIITIPLLILVFNIILLRLGNFTVYQLYTYNFIYIIALTMAASINYFFELSIRKDFLHHQALQLDRKKYAELAKNDALTGLANRFGFTHRFNELIDFTVKDKSINKSIGVLIFIDLNRFKPINDQYGHCVGDEVLKIIAGRLINTTYSDNNIVARLGGDEFIIFLHSLYLEDMIDDRINDLSQLIAKPMSIRVGATDTSLSVSASIGYSIVHNNEISIDEVICRADDNMYLHKKSRT